VFVCGCDRPSQHLATEVRMDNHPNDNLHTCADTQWTSKKDYYSNTTSCPEKQRKKVIYNRSRIVHVDEMIRAILPKLDTVQQASVQHYYDAWKRKQLKTHHLLVHLRNIVSLDLLHSEVERIRQDKWRKSRRQSTRRNNRLFTVATNNNNNNITTPENEETKTNNNSGPCNLPTEEHAAVSVKRSWTKEEHFLFLQGLEEYGKGQWQSIANKIGTKTASQVRSHCKKYLMRQQKDEQSKKMKTIHDMTLESPEMQQLAKKQQQQTKKENNLVITNNHKESFWPPFEQIVIDRKDGDNHAKTYHNIDSTRIDIIDQKHGEQTKIPYFIRERRIRNLERCLLQTKQSVHWMLSQLGNNCG
jgi:SHAQKYF class myb-like DNA-binding protein